MVADLIALLEREQEHLMRLDGVAFMRRLPAYVAAITDTAAVSEILDGMEAEAQGALDEYVETTNGLMQQAVTLRDQLVTREPGSDDSSAPEPEDEATHAYSEYMFTLARFNQLNETTVKVTYPKLPSDQVEDKPLPEMLNILRGKVHVLQFGEGPDPNRPNQRPDLDDLKIELVNLAEQQGHTVRTFADASKTLPGVAVKRLQLFADRLSPEAVLLAPDASLAERADRLLGYWWTPESSVHKALSGAQLDDYDERRFESIVSDLKAQADLVHTELVGRLSRADIRRRSKWWRKAGSWLAAHVGAPLLQQAVIWVIVLVLGVVGGYLLGTRGDSGPNQTVTVTTSTANGR